MSELDQVVSEFLKKYLMTGNCGAWVEAPDAPIIYMAQL